MTIANNMLARMRRKGNTCILLVAMYVSTATMENGIELLKLKIELPYDLATPLLGIYPKERKSVH